MRPVYQAAGLLFLGLGVYVAWESQNLSFYTRVGPGPGFFPFWLGLGMTLLSVIFLAQVTFRPVEAMEKGFVPPRSGMIQVGLFVLALVVVYLLMDILGFRLVMLGFLVFTLAVMGRQNLLVTGVVSVAGSFGLFYAFKNWLSVHLSVSSIQLLNNLGL